jgi:predicted nuclease of restriction endonuclease-like (RecB) superfamily
MKNEIVINDKADSFDGEDEKAYQKLLNNIETCQREGRAQALRAVNEKLVDTNWNNGRYIVEYEQGWKARAKYGMKLIDRLAQDLTLRLGKGFSRSNLRNMRTFYLRFPIHRKVSGELSWSHYCELISIDDELEREFYYHQAQIENWSISELKRQKRTGLFLQLATSKDKTGIMKLAQKGRLIETPEDAVKSVYFLEFLNIHAPYHIKERKLESRIYNNLPRFMLELGKGFTYVGRQVCITLNNIHYYVDYVFYHRILRCFVLIDLKVNKVQHYDISQMNMYLGYYAAEENGPDDNPPIGIILTREQDELLVKYATYEMNSQLFVSKYQLYLPDKEELRKLLYENLDLDDKPTEGGDDL